MRRLQQLQQGRIDSPHEEKPARRGPGGSLHRLVDSPQLFEQFLYGLALVDEDGDVLYLNQKARELVVPTSRQASSARWRCCDLICSRVDAGGCLTGQVATGRVMPEVRVDIEREALRTSVWVTGSPLTEAGGRVLFLLRPGRPGDRRRRIPSDWSHQASSGDHAKMRVSTLGRFQLEIAGTPIHSEWLGQRPGHLLKYLICERRRIVASDQIAEALWPEAGQSEARSRLRYFVHVLREKIEPDRAKRSPSRFVLSQRGGYILDTSQMWIDADEFEREVRAGLATLDQGLTEPAAAHLRNALTLYQDGFLSDDPYADWALDERERLHELAGRALRAKIQIYMEQGRFATAAEHARRLSDMEPFDTDVQKAFIEICLRRGRRSEAHRRYAVLRKRMLSAFEQEPGFSLAELERQIA